MIAGRLRELGYSPDVTEDRQLLSMIRACINAELVAGRQENCDEPDHLARLVDMARRRIEQGEAWISGSPDPAAPLTARYR